LFGRRFVAVLVLAAAGLSTGQVQAQEDLTRGKTPAQLFTSDCSDCHKNPRGLANRGNAGGLADFLRVHYTASRESAAAIAGYLVSLGTDPVDRTPSRPTSSSRTQEQGRSSGQRTRPADKPSETAAPKSNESRPTESRSNDSKSPEPKSPEPKSAESKPAESKASESKPAESKPTESKPVESKPVEAAPSAPAAPAPASEPAPAAPPANPQ
jgi:hypothetical protein